MKLRLTKDEVRVRLSSAELNDFAVLGQIDERLDLGETMGGSFAFSLRTGEVTEPVAVLADFSLTVSVPVDLAKRWAGSELIGIEADQRSGASPVRILVEKDLGRRSERFRDGG